MLISNHITPMMNTDPTSSFVNTIIGALIGGLLSGMLNSTQVWNSSGTIMQMINQTMSHVENWVASGIISMAFIGLNSIGSYYDKV